MQGPERSYGRVAWCYDELAAAWSLGAIPRVKAYVAEQLEPASRALFVGVGRGSDALRAVRRGVEVTGLDVAPAMLGRFERGLAREGLPARVERASLFDLEPTGDYDAVVASFVLNVFEPDAVRLALPRLLGALRPGGRLWVSDFAPPAGPLWRRMAARLHYAPVAAVGAALGLAALHPIYDYGPELEACGARTRLVARRGLYCVWVAEWPGP